MNVSPRNNIPNAETIEKFFRLNDEDGRLYWQENLDRELFKTERMFNHYHTTKAGSLAGRGYKMGNNVTYSSILFMDYGVFYEHHLIWCMYYGVVDEYLEIDHLDGDGLNNRIDNMIQCSKSTNQKNLPKKVTNTSGHVGVSCNKKSGKYEAYITVDYKKIALGQFLKKEDAISARVKAEIKYNFHPNNGKTVEDRRAYEQNT